MSDLRERRQILLLGFGLVFIVFALRLFYLQVVSSDFAAYADRNVIKRQRLEPSRGIVYDRKGRIYVTNSPIFDLNITPSDLRIPDTTVFIRHLQLDRESIRKRIRTATEYNKHKPSLFEKQINANVYAGLQEHLWQTNGIGTVVRTTRNYLYPVGANFLGYISEVNKKDIGKSDGYYEQGDLIGTSGMERQYERLLRGEKGVKMTLVDVHGKEVGPFAASKFDTIPQKGEDVMISVDAELQLFGEALMANKIGSIVAIEPASGEILSFVSAPSYDPNLLSGQEYNHNWRALKVDTLLPLFNRPLMAMYPPGSIFKLLNALCALEEGTLTEYMQYPCYGGFARNGGRPKCHAHPSPLDLKTAIQHSCNAYFAGAYLDMLHNPVRFKSFNQGFNTWYEHMEKFGVGHRIGVDIPNEKTGLLPNEKFYNKWYGANRWFGMTIISNSIGQGELLMTPLQMANVVAMLANRGHYIQPHFFKSMMGRPARKLAHFDTIRTAIDPKHFATVVDGMELVVSSGTGWMAQIPGISVCGKTGTAENPHGEDHSVFFAFAPKENPKIAIAVIVENAGWGGEWAAPIASLMIEQYLTGSIKDGAKLKRILDADFVRKGGYYATKTQHQILNRTQLMQAVLAQWQAHQPKQPPVQAARPDPAAPPQPSATPSTVPVATSPAVGGQ